MKELLERIAKVMPEGWSLVWRVASRCQTSCGDVTISHLFLKDSEYDDEDLKLEPNGGDIGLAPLTALLKQDMEWPMETSGVLANGERRYGFVYCGSEDVYWGDTEFEAVANAYLAIKEKI